MYKPPLGPLHSNHEKVYCICGIFPKNSVNEFWWYVLVLHTYTDICQVTWMYSICQRIPESASDSLRVCDFERLVPLPRPGFFCRCLFAGAPGNECLLAFKVAKWSSECSGDAVFSFDVIAVHLPRPSPRFLRSRACSKNSRNSNVNVKQIGRQAFWGLEMLIWLLVDYSLTPFFLHLLDCLLQSCDFWKILFSEILLRSLRYWYTPVGRIVENGWPD